ncbi:MAG: DEAD/DEAH box helicase family protein [Gammaproteobacteria bacterium AqS3]|nr:DEAD/DEAH box helicase family protein [Gammaproteobacteria bacterium AqS3]
MPNKPNLVDNLDGNTMATALRELLQTHDEDITMVAEPRAQVDEARIATAYFSPEGFSRIAQAIKNIPSIRLLLGSDPIADKERWKRRLDENEQRFIARKLRENLRQQEESLRAERDHIRFSKKDSQAVRQLVNSLRSGNMQVRRYEENFLHAKAYIFTSSDEDDVGKPEGVLAGSSNLTAAGLSSNLELNLGRYDHPTVQKAKCWFDRLWDDAVPFDLAKFFEEIFEPKTPFEIFLRVLWELYGDEVDQDLQQDQGLPLTSFQKHGVVRALRLIQETGGVIVADEVGLGKTFIAGEILAHYRAHRQRALLICPASLRDTSWSSFQSEFELYLETLSFEQLSQDRQLWDEKRRPHAAGHHLKRDIEEYQLIIIDEAHNYRNPDSPTRADALRALLYGKRKDLLMLTATPVNNSLWDLYHLTRFFIKQDSFLAGKGILSIKQRFDDAMKTNPNSLSPDVLYPIVDATTVKRTRQFIKKHYPNDQVKINNEMQTIVFPEPVAISVRYNLEDLMPGLFDLIETYFDPENDDCIFFARYKTKTYLKVPDEEGERMANAVTGLLLSGLLKRFESSTGAFRISIDRLIRQHKHFLRALDDGHVVSTEFLNESTSLDNDEDFNKLLESSDEKVDAKLYDRDRLRKDVEQDLGKLEEIFARLENIEPAQDPKLLELSKQLEFIAEEAANQASSRKDEMNKRKVLIFSFFADTVRWVNKYLADEIASNPKLSAYKGRFEIVVGSGDGEEKNRAAAARRFAPDTAGKSGDPNETDILITTDVLAEGVNLQQARHIINYDMPWNPMRLVQRHGRIDRIGSQHSRVYMRSIFPVEQLDALLRLEERISRKIAMAAASVGVVSPIADVSGSNRDFTETKEEIQKLLEEDPSLYERGGTDASTQSGEEYRQTLRKALESRREQIIQMPWKAGSGIRKGSEQGIFFCAKVGERTYLRFVHANEDWSVKYLERAEDGKGLVSAPLVDDELGRCLRLIECSENDECVMDDTIQDAAYDLWLIARKNIHQRWDYETDPANLQPSVRLLNRKVADFIRGNTPSDIEQKQIDKVLDIVEAPWPMRDERRLREWFQSDERQNKNDKQRAKHLIEKVLASGLEPFIAPEPLPPIKEEDIELLVWMGVSPAHTTA